MSPDGKSYAFDDRANGYGRGEGVAALILKRLDDAVAAGDPIRAVIRATALNQDGKTTTITTPSQEAQQELIQRCYEQAGIDPEETGYVEAHGTGTSVGDPIEIGAIAEALRGRARANNPLLVGSVKAAIGHTEAASGLASVIKVVMSLEKGMIAPNCDFRKPNGKLHLSSRNIQVRIAKSSERPTSTDIFRFPKLSNHGRQSEAFGEVLSTTLVSEGQMPMLSLKSTWRTFTPRRIVCLMAYQLPTTLPKKMVHHWKKA